VLHDVFCGAMAEEGKEEKRAGNGRCQVLMACLSAPRPVNWPSFSGHVLAVMVKKIGEFFLSLITN